MLTPGAMAGAAALAGGIGILCMAWVVLAALSADGARGRAFALLAATAALGSAPLGLRALRGGAAPPQEGTVFLGATLLLAAAAICLWRLRTVAGAGIAARAGIGCCAVIWALLWVLWSDLI